VRLLVCGSREWPGSWEDIAIHLPDERCTIIHGACSRVVRKQVGTRRGVPEFANVEVSVDMLAGWCARQLGHDVEPHPVDYALDGPWPAAGPRRNARMLRESKPTHGLAFGALVKPAGASLTAGLKTTGTGNMVGLMLAARLRVRWVPAPGEPAQDLTTMPAPPQAELDRDLDAIWGPT
jgi:hypothetical protein